MSGALELIDDGDAFVRLRRFNPMFPAECVKILSENRIHFGCIRSQDDAFEEKGVRDNFTGSESTLLQDGRPLPSRKCPLPLLFGVA